MDNLNEEIEVTNSSILNEEFTELFPDVKIADIPDEVFARAVNEDIPLVAAYTLYDRKVYMDNLKVEEFNKKNASNSPGKIKHDGASEGLFTLEQIKRMSPKEVDKYYDQIIKSLEVI